LDVPVASLSELNLKAAAGELPPGSGEQSLEGALLPRVAQQIRRRLALFALGVYIGAVLN
jgi:hypothetical protein